MLVGNDTPHRTGTSSKLRKRVQRGTIDLPQQIRDTVQVYTHTWPSGDNPPYDTALIMSKIGRYMATIIPPTTAPRKTIIMGSMAERRASTAASTSSS
jgi:hypothetical protein